MKMQLSPNLTLAEAIKSQQATRLGIDNNPTPEHLLNLKQTAQAIFQPIRGHFRKPIAVTSGYRSKALNDAIGGASKSQHCSGQALDIDGDVFGGVKNSEIFDFAKTNLPFDQLIWEFGDDKEPAWVHISHRADGKNRKQILRAQRIDGKTVYTPM